MTTSATAILGPFLLAVLTAGGCVSFGKSDPASLYLLSSMPATGHEADSVDGDLLIGIRKVSISDYLDRAEIVTRSGRNQVSVSPFQRWAQPLDEDIARVLAANLAILKSVPHVLEFPWRASKDVDYEVEVTVLRFEQVESGEILLRAGWSILEGGSENALVATTSEVSRPVEGSGYESIVGAMSLACEDLSREIAAAIPSSPRSAAE